MSLDLRTKDETINLRVINVVLTVKNLSANAGDEIQVQSLDCEDSLEESMATHSSILAWGIPWTEEPGALQSIGLPRVRHN